MNQFNPLQCFFAKVLSQTPLNVVYLNNLQIESFTSVFSSLDINGLTIEGVQDAI